MIISSISLQHTIGTEWVKNIVCSNSHELKYFRELTDAIT